MNSSNNSTRLIRVGRVLRDVKPVNEPARPAAQTAAASARSAPATPGATDDTQRRGYEDGLARGQAQSAEVLRLLEQISAQYRESLGDLQRSMNEQVVPLALAIAQKLLGRELHDPAAIRGLIQRAVAELPRPTAIRVNLNPQDLAVLEAHKGWLQQHRENLPEDMILCADPSLRRGGCQIESPVGNVDARLETQLELIEQALRTLDDSGAADDDAHAAQP